ncbi:hypothetical protein LIA77_12006 [Sarocladium implicatum]|nr:hypothetical protein LIA77_12006 [Sarocladium implicatum]
MGLSRDAPPPAPASPPSSRLVVPVPTCLHKACAPSSSAGALPQAMPVKQVRKLASMILRQAPSRALPKENWEARPTGSHGPREIDPAWPGKHSYRLSVRAWKAPRARLDIPEYGTAKSHQALMVRGFRPGRSSLSPAEMIEASSYVTSVSISAPPFQRDGR